MEQLWLKRVILLANIVFIILYFVIEDKEFMRAYFLVSLLIIVDFFWNQTNEKRRKEQDKELNIAEWIKTKLSIYGNFFYQEDFKRFKKLVDKVKDLKLDKAEKEFLLYVTIQKYFLNRKLLSFYLKNKYNEKALNDLENFIEAQKDLSKKKQLKNYMVFIKDSNEILSCLRIPNDIGFLKFFQKEYF